MTATGTSEMPADSRFWTRRILAVRLRINAGWWAQALLPACFLASVGLVAFILSARRAGWPSRWTALAAAAAALLALGGSFLRARRRFIGATAARAHIESTLALHSRLSSAAAGVGAWPARGEWKPGALRWNWRALAGLPLLSAALVAAAFLFPIPPAPRVAPLPLAKPPALASVEEMLDALEQSPAIDPASLEQPREQAEQLAEQNPAEWYSHASLEAADHLRAQLRAGTQTLADQAGTIDAALGQAGTGELSDEQAGAISGQIGGALASLGGNLPGLNRALANRLREIDPTKLRTLSPEQLESLREGLRGAKGACRRGLGKGEGEEEGEDGDGEDDGEKRRAGRGGITRGPGAAPLTLTPDPADLGTKKTEALEAEDFRDIALGDRVGMSAGAHDVDRTSDHRAAGGGTAATGAGPDAVWIQQNLTPDERRRLRAFFK